MAELEVVAEEDAELNRQGKPAINKLKKLSLLTDVLSKLVTFPSCVGVVCSYKFNLLIAHVEFACSVENNFSKSFLIMES